MFIKKLQHFQKANYGYFVLNFTYLRKSVEEIDPI